MNALDAGNVFLPTGDAKFGDLDYVIDSNSMYEKVDGHGRHPRADRAGERDLPQGRRHAQGRQLHPDQRRAGRRQAGSLHPGLPPAWRQHASTWSQNLRDSLTDMEGRLTRSGINLKLVMDQSVYVHKSIEALVQEGLLGAILCSLVILIFLGEWRMTGIAIMTLPISVWPAAPRSTSRGRRSTR